MTAQLNPSMLILARESRGLTVTELARRVEVTPGYVSKVENGIVTPSQNHMEALARALHYPLAFLTRQDRIVGFDSPCLYHRKRKTLPVKALRLVEAQMHVMRLEVRELLDEMDVEAPYAMHTLDADEYGSPEKVAQALRRAWGIPRGPVPNLTSVIEAAGGIVVLADFGHGKLDGLSCWEKNGPPFFYLNSQKSPEILRFTLAHELGHLTMHYFPTADPEGEADRFAAEFLMPASEVRSQLQGLQFAKLGPLKTYWRISMRNLITRADRLGCITPSRSRSLYVQLSQKGYVANEPYPLSPEEPSLVGKALRVHLEDHKYARQELAELVVLYEDELLTKFGDQLPNSGIRQLHSIQDRHLA